MITYDSNKRELICYPLEEGKGEPTKYEVYTGKSLDTRIANIVRFAEGDMTLQEVYTELLHWDKEELFNELPKTQNLCEKNGIVRSMTGTQETVLSKTID